MAHYLTKEVQWQLVDEVFDKGWECFHCPHLDRVPDREDEPGGRLCGLMANTAIMGTCDPTMCPGYGQHLDLFEEELQTDLLEELEAQEVD